MGRRVHVYSDQDYFLASLDHSPYFQALLQRPNELHYKYPTSSPRSDLFHGTRALTPTELNRARTTVDDAYTDICRTIPALCGVRVSINILLLTDTRIESASSWTDGTTIVLSTWSSLAHEVCHIFQRVAPQLFDTLYLRMGFVPLPPSTYHDLLQRYPDRLIDNPDMCFRYYAWNGWVCAYERGMKPIFVRIDEEEIIFWSPPPPLNHPHEKMANLF